MHAVKQTNKQKITFKATSTSFGTTKATRTKYYLVYMQFFQPSRPMHHGCSTIIHLQVLLSQVRFILISDHFYLCFSNYLIKFSISSTFNGLAAHSPLFEVTTGALSIFSAKTVIIFKLCPQKTGREQS